MHRTPSRSAPAVRTARLLHGLFAGLLLSACAAASELSAVRPLSPVEGMDFTDLATSFRWAPLPGIDTYDIQIAADPGFTQLVREKRLLSRGYHKYLYFPKDLLSAGEYHWRVRAVRENATGPWSAARRFRVNSDHTPRPELVRQIGPEHPLFLMRSRTWDPLKSSAHVDAILPASLKGVIVIDDIALASERVLERARAYQELGLDFVVWNNRCQVPLTTLEYLFQNFDRCIGTAEGEHFSGMYWERGPEGNLSEYDFVHRAWALCAKYGRFYFFADGDGGSIRWPEFARREREYLERYRRNLVLMFKTTNGDMALHSYGAIQGFLAAGWVENTGTWADEWIWPCSGFGKLGELVPDDHVWALRRKLGTRQCPWNYDIQIWLMGLASGATVFHLESAHQWNADGRGAAQYERVFKPFVRAVVERKLIPSRRALLAGIPLAVVGDPELVKGRHGKQYTGALAWLRELYALKERGDRELLPNDSRYGLLCLLPPGGQPLHAGTETVPLAQLADPAEARTRFDARFPRRFSGDAFMWECDGTVIVTNSCENQDLAQSFQMPLQSALVRELSGSIGVHEYLIAKIPAGGHSFWFQTNGEYPDRTFTVTLACTRRPDCSVQPAAALLDSTWSAERGTLTLRLSRQPGAVDVELR